MCTGGYAFLQHLGPWDHGKKLVNLRRGRVEEKRGILAKSLHQPAVCSGSSKITQPQLSHESEPT